MPVRHDTGRQWGASGSCTQTAGIMRRHCLLGKQRNTCCLYAVSVWALGTTWCQRNVPCSVGGFGPPDCPLAASAEQPTTSITPVQSPTHLSLVEELHTRQLPGEYLCSRLPVLTGEAQAACNIDVNRVRLHQQNDNLQQHSRSGGAGVRDGPVRVAGRHVGSSTHKCSVCTSSDTCI